MSIKKYWDYLTSRFVNVLDSLSFNGTEVLTPTHTSGRSLQIKNVANPSDQQDVVTLAYLETQQGGAAVTKVNLIDPVGGNVSVGLASVVGIDAVSPVDISVPEEAYDIAWSNSPEVPTKKDVYAKIETLVVKETGKGLASTEELAKLANAPEIAWIQLLSASTVAGRIAAGVTGSAGTETWGLAPGASPVDLVITHNKGKRVPQVTVVAIDGTQEQQLFNTAAYNGIITPDANTLRIQSLATITKAIKIYIQFV